MDEPVQTPDEGTPTPEPVTETPQVPETPVVENPTPPAPPAPEPPAPPDYREKFKESAREAQLLLGRTKELERTIGKLTAEDIPNENELLSEYPNWVYMTDTEKELAVKSSVTQRRLNRITLEMEQTKMERQKDTEIEAELATNAKLAGKEAEFRAYAKKEKNAGIPLDTLVNAFLFEVKDDLPPSPTPSGQVQNQPVLNSGGAGGDMGSPNEEYTIEEAANIRKKNPKKYNELIRSGKLKQFRE